MIGQTVAAAIGVWLMAAPAVLGYEDATASDVQRTLGPIAASIAIVAVFQATRGIRRANYLVGFALVAASLVVGGPLAAMINGVASGVAIGLLSTVEGRRTKQFGGGWRALVED